MNLKQEVDFCFFLLSLVSVIFFLRSIVFWSFFSQHRLPLLRSIQKFYYVVFRLRPFLHSIPHSLRLAVIVKSLLTLSLIVVLWFPVLEIISAPLLKVIPSFPLLLFVAEFLFFLTTPVLSWVITSFMQGCMFMYLRTEEAIFFLYVKLSTFTWLWLKPRKSI